MCWRASLLLPHRWARSQTDWPYFTPALRMKKTITEQRSHRSSFRWRGTTFMTVAPSRQQWSSASVLYRLLLSILINLTICINIDCSCQWWSFDRWISVVVNMPSRFSDFTTDAAFLVDGNVFTNSSALGERTKTGPNPRNMISSSDNHSFNMVLDLQEYYTWRTTTEEFRF